MRLYGINGKLIDKNVNKYVIKWDKPSRSIIQFKVKQFLKPYWSSLIVYEEFPVYQTLLKVDLLNATLKIAIEVNGPQHNEFHYFHNKNPNNYLKGFKNDVIKSEWLAKNGFKLIEINHNEINLLSKTFFLEKFSLSL